MLFYPYLDVYIKRLYTYFNYTAMPLRCAWNKMILSYSTSSTLTLHKVYGEAWCEYIGVVTCTVYINADAMRARFYVCMHVWACASVREFISLCARAMSVDVYATLRKWIHWLLAFLCVLSVILCFSVYFISCSLFLSLSFSFPSSPSPHHRRRRRYCCCRYILYSVQFYSIPFAPIDSTIA